MTAGLPVRPQCPLHVELAQPVQFYPIQAWLLCLGGTNTGEPWEQFSVDQSIKSSRNGSETKHLVFIAGHLSRQCEPAHRRLTSQLCLCSNHHSTWAQLSNNFFVQCISLINSSLPSAAYMRQWIESILVQIMACRLFGAKPLFKPMLYFWQLDP